MTPWVLIDTDFLTDCFVWSVIGLLGGVLLGYILRVLHERTGRL